MPNFKCPWCDKCRNGNDGCYTIAPESCIRFMPLEGTNLTNIDGVVETPPDIDYDKFSQFFMNWIESMGWGFCGSIKRHEEDSDEV